MTTTLESFRETTEEGVFILSQTVTTSVCHKLKNKKEIMPKIGINSMVRLINSFLTKKLVSSVCVLILEHCHLVTTQTIWRLKE